MKKHGWTLPGGGRIVLRELTAPQLDNLAVRAATAQTGNVILAALEEQKLGAIDSILEVDGERVSEARNSEELFYALTARQRLFVEKAWTSVHEAPADLTERVLATHEDLGDGAHRWQAKVDEVAEIQAEIDALQRTAVEPIDPKLTELHEDLERVRSYGWIELVEISGVVSDQVGASVFAAAGDDIASAIAAESRQLLDRSIKQARGQRGDGRSMYAQLSPFERSFVAAAFDRINSVQASEVVAFLGTREAVE